jgi:hypothetical protein
VPFGSGTGERCGCDRRTESPHSVGYVPACRNRLLPTGPHTCLEARRPGGPAERGAKVCCIGFCCAPGNEVLELSELAFARLSDLARDAREAGCSAFRQLDVRSLATIRAI